MGLQTKEIKASGAKLIDQIAFYPKSDMTLWYICFD
jgi:hypothetical protein